MSLLKKSVLFFLCLLLPSYVAAQTSIDSLQELKAVIITAKPFTEVIPVQSLSGQKLERMNSLSVADALRYFAGVQVKDYGGLGGLKTIDVRNMGTHHIGNFYDGIEIGNAQNGVVDMGRFSLDDMESISLYNGQKSEIFQSAKEFMSASTVYMWSKKPKFKEGKNTNLTLRYRTMSIDYINPSLRLEQKLSDKVSMNVSGEYQKSNGRYKYHYKRVFPDGSTAYDTTAIRKNSDIEAFRIETGVYGQITDGSWYAKLYYYDSDRGSPGAIVAGKFSDGYRQSDRSFFAQGRLTKDIDEKYHLQVKGKFSFDYLHYLAQDTTEVNNEGAKESLWSNDRYYQQEAYLSVINLYNINSWWDVSLSADYQWNKLNGTRKYIKTKFPYPRRNSIVASLATSVDLGKVKAMASIVGNYIDESVKDDTKTENKRVVTPAAFIGYKPFEDYDFNLRAFAKRSFRMPTFNDMYYAQVGSSTLKPEYMNQYNIGFTYARQFNNSPFFDSFTLQADAYITRTKDKIIASPTGSLFRWMMSNTGKVKGRGIETVANIGMHVGKVKLATNLSYTYSSARDYSNKWLTSYGDQIPYTPWHSGSAVLNTTYKTWDLNYSFIYVGKRYNGGVNNIPVNRVQPWYTHDISLQKKFHINDIAAKVSVEVNNLLAQDYEVIYNYPMPLRTFRFTFSIDL
ncbi:TonB-dependent receptor [Dysgonomonas sp. 25]|uniref:TonB-dependent receptor n=1 Tax=Dysgonomonas sp. 25 TaxID=2302933 RepID=UPI0013D4FAF5|nr:TonB-dependent receptor plug domain-containing protein [Dysgonomonas sp. 25]NDV68742.1 TonB-dependent receptor [Dysgonomonas sp. 25]